MCEAPLELSRSDFAMKRRLALRPSWWRHAATACAAAIKTQHSEEYK